MPDTKVDFLCVKSPTKAREVLHGVSADGVGAKFPFFAVNLAVVCPCPLGEEEKSEEKRRKAKKKRKNAQKNEKCVKKGENHSDPIYTNPIKNLPKSASVQVFMAVVTKMCTQGFGCGSPSQSVLALFLGRAWPEQRGLGARSSTDKVCIYPSAIGHTRRWSYSPKGRVSAFQPF